MDLYSTIGTKTYKNLLADPRDAEPISVNVKPGQGELAIGQILYRNANGLYEKAASGQMSTSYDLVVLGEDLAANTGDVADTALVFRKGCFLDGKVFLAAGTALTAAYKVTLRLFGIVFNVDSEAGEFNNGSWMITYNPNNSVATDKPVSETALNGETYTILNNSSSKLGFTAPATKSFSKWNTKADGSGTDYAAAASYTATADLTLYAVWA